jgi:biotin transport system substrate-specific component
VVLLAGALIGPARGTASQVTYLGMGLAGAPIFAAGAAGVTALSGPTGGYLLGFAVAPVIVARCIGTRRGFVRALLGFSAGALAILALGVAHLAVLYTHDLATAVRVGFLPFVPGDALKVLAAASIYCGYRRLLAERSAC